jgi:hypothetical protein
MRAPYRMEYIVTVSPMPSVRARVATNANPGLLASERMP